MSLVKLSDAEIAAKLESLPEWSQPGEEIQRTYRFRDFVAAMAFVDEIAAHAEAVQHHPDILVRWNKVSLTLSTHDASGIATLMERMPAAMSQDSKTTVLEATVSGDSAAVRQELAATMVRPGPDGNEMKMEMSVTSNDIWVKSGDTWLLKTSFQKDLVVKRDGEVFFKQSN